MEITFDDIEAKPDLSSSSFRGYVHDGTLLPSVIVVRERRSFCLATKVRHEFEMNCRDYRAVVVRISG